MAREAVTVRIGVAHLPRRCLSRPGPLDQRSVRGPPSASGSCWPASLPALPPVRDSKPSAGQATATEGLIVLAATADGTALLGWDGSSREGVPITLPKSDATWIATGRADVLAAVLPKGTTATSDPVHLGDPLVWRPVKATDITGKTPVGPDFFATWDPEGGRFATLAGDLPGGGAVNVVLIDPSAGSAFEIAIDRAVVAAPPVWIDPDRLVVVTGDAAAPLAAIVDTTTSEVTDGPSGDRLLAASGDGKRIATMAGPGRPGRGAGHGRLARRRRLAARVDRPADELRDGDRLRPGWDRSATRRGMGGGGRLGQPRRPRWGLGLATRGAAGPRRGARRGGRLASLRMWRPGRGARGQAVTASAAAKIETCASSGSITPKTFWSARRWTHDPPTLEVVAGATPLTAVEPDVMGVVIATECEREMVDRDPIELSGVAIRLLDLADQGAVHRSATSVAHMGARGAAVRSAPRPVMAVAWGKGTPATGSGHP